MSESNTWPIIVGGAHRSGTTLLRRLLNGHSRIFCPAEIKFHKDLLRQFPKDELAHGRLGSSIKALGLPEAVWLDELGRAFVRCYEIAAARNNKARWADKSPENALNVEHWNRLLSGKMHFVLVVRHPFDVLASIEETRMEKVIPSDSRARAEHVRSYVSSGLRFVDAHPLRSSMVRYEELVQDPAGALRSLMERVGEEFESQMLELLGSKTHEGGLQDPKSLGRSRVTTDGVGRWRQDLLPGDLQEARPVLTPLMARLGYQC